MSEHVSRKGINLPSRFLALTAVLPLYLSFAHRLTSEKSRQVCGREELI